MPPAAVTSPPWKGIGGAVDFDGQTGPATWMQEAALHLDGRPGAISHPYFFAEFPLARSSPSQVTRAPRLPHLDIASDAELHNRQELIRALDPPEGASSDNVALIAAAYERWGEECAEHLEGEFAFAIRDQRNNSLFCCRDQLGSQPLFFWRHGNRFAFASDPRIILGLPGVERKLNSHKLAALATGGTQHHYSDETFHAGILSLPAATWMRVDAGGIRQNTYWTPEIRENLIPRKPDQALEALRGLVFNAVSSRLAEKKAAVMLSGGLDSSTVASVAAHTLEGRNRVLTAVSSVLPEELRDQLTDERAFIEEFRSCPNLRIEYVTAPNRGPFDSIENERAFEVTPLRTSRHYLYEAFDVFAASEGTEVILGGEFGELGLSHGGYGYFTELAVRLRFPELWREMRQMGAARGVSTARIAARAAIEPFERADSAPSAILAGDFVAGFPAVPDFRNTGGKHWKDHRLYHRDLIRRWLRKHSSVAAQSLGRRTRFSCPLLDRRLIEFCLAAPGHLRIHGGYARYMARGALGGILPEKIRWRTSKNPFSPDYYFRYNAQLPKVRDFVAAIRPNDPIRSIVDVNRLAQMLREVDPLKRDSNALALIPTTIYLICFLRQFGEFRA